MNKFVDWFTVKLGSAFIISVGILLAGANYMDARRNEDYAKKRYIDAADIEAAKVALTVQDKLNSIYENTRTLASLPSVRTIGRHGENISDDSRKTFQQIYNNLASNIDLSEVYILPVDFDPDKIDPVTGKHEEPIIMFDEIIVNGGQASTGAIVAEGDLHQPVEQEEVEIFEYRQYRDQFKWLSKNYPDSSKIVGLNVPMISGPEIITCDNRDFIISRNDADRTGMTFTVPFFGDDGKLRGAVTAIIRSKSLHALLPTQDYVLFNQSYSFSTRRGENDQTGRSAPWVDKGIADPSLIYSQVVNIDTKDAQGQWKIWTGKPDTEFTNSPEAKFRWIFELSAYGIILVLTLGALAYLRKFWELAEKERQSTIAAYRDMLSTLPNRRAVVEQLSQYQAAAPFKPFTLLYLDLDGFKAVNDTYNHEIGDKLIRHVSNGFSEIVAGDGQVARLGGDEFAIIIPNT